VRLQTALPEYDWRLFAVAQIRQTRMGHCATCFLLSSLGLTPQAGQLYANVSHDAPLLLFSVRPDRIEHGRT